jgi:predicted adenylyl cyclase CyaB
MKNLEIKACGIDFVKARRALRTVGAVRQPRPLLQTDWYFVVPHGRLKVRQRKGERGAELIVYVRPDAERARASNFQRLPTEDAAHLLRLLRAMFEPWVCVRKRRELWLIGDTRIHLDDVDGLGKFLEIEVPVGSGLADARRMMRLLTDRLEIEKANLLGVSYSDLIARAPRAHALR